MRTRGKYRANPDIRAPDAEMYPGRQPISSFRIGIYAVIRHFSAPFI